jgi:ACR3 family arsenite efflux pump ArsB
MSARAVPPSRLWWLAAGFGVWFSALAILYALHAIGCAFAWRAGPLRLGLVLALLAHLIAIGWIWRDLARAHPDPAFGQTGTFLHTVVVWTLIAAFVATAFTLGPTLLLTTCV